MASLELVPRTESRSDSALHGKTGCPEVARGFGSLPKTVDTLPACARLVCSSEPEGFEFGFFQVAQRLTSFYKAPNAASK